MKSRSLLLTRLLFARGVILQRERKENQRKENMSSVTEKDLAQMMVQEIDLMRTLERMELQIEQLTDKILCYGLQRASASLQCQMDRNTLDRLRNLKKQILLLKEIRQQSQIIYDLETEFPTLVKKNV